MKDYDFYMPEPDYWDCEEDGHDYKFLGSTDDGDCFYKCKKCGEEHEE